MLRDGSWGLAQGRQRDVVELNWNTELRFWAPTGSPGNNRAPWKAGLGLDASAFFFILSPVTPVGHFYICSLRRV